MTLCFIIMVKMIAKFTKKKYFSIILGIYETVARVIFLMAKTVLVFCQQVLWLKYFNQRFFLFHPSAAQYLNECTGRERTLCQSAENSESTYRT